MHHSLKFFHRFLAIILGLFLSAHFLVHMSAIWGIEIYFKFFTPVQMVYRNKFIEPLLVIAFLSQVYVGIQLLKRCWKNPRKRFWHWMQLLSGIYLAGFVLLHIAAALATRLVFGLETNFYWAAGTVNLAPIKYLFVPYYFLGLLSVFAHLSAAVHLRWRSHGKTIAPIILAGGTIVAGLIVTTYAGLFYEIDIPREYLEYYRSYLMFSNKN